MRADAGALGLRDPKRTLRVGDVLPVPLKTFWPELKGRWEKVRVQFGETIGSIGQVQNLLDHRFQDFTKDPENTPSRGDAFVWRFVLGAI